MIAKNDSAGEVKTIMFNDDPKISIAPYPESIENVDEYSPTSSSTPIKMYETNRTSPFTDTNTIIDMSSTNFDTIEYTNQIIMNSETTEKVMKVLNESMQCFNSIEEWQQESLQHFGRVQVSFILEGNFFL